MGEALKKYYAKLDEFKIRPKKEEGQQIREAAAAAGQSVQQYVLDAVRARMGSDMEKGQGEK